MASTIRLKRSHEQVLKDLFSSLDDRISSHNGQSFVKGFWQSGICSRLNPDFSIDSKNRRGDGFWRATSSTVYGNAELLSVVFGGDVRIGILIPNTVLEVNTNIRSEISCLYNGKPASAERDIGVMHFFDWVFQDAPFSAEWMHRCSYDDVAFEILKNKFLWLTIHLWEGFARIISASYGNAIPIFSSEYIQPDIAEKHGLTITDRYPYQYGDKIYKITLVKTESGTLSEETKKSILEYSPDCVFSLNIL